MDNGSTNYSVGARYKGNTSYGLSGTKKSINLEFDFVGTRQEATDLKAPLVGQLVCFRDFGKTTRVFEAPVQTAT